MLLPTQQTYGLAATNLMQSMLDSAEEQRKKDEAERTGKERDKITEARISASEEAKRARDKIASALFGSNNVDPNELKMDLLERVAKEVGLDPDEARSSFKFGKAVEDIVKTMPDEQVRKIEEDLGLKDLGITMDTLIAAIKNPYADDAQHLKDALTKKANGGKIGADVDRVVQRMEDIADPKTLEELKVGPQGYDPTRVEDAETRAERKDDIAAAEAGKKLEDVQKVQDAIEEKNDDTKVEPGKTGTDGEVKADAGELLTLFAAAAEQVGDSEPVKAEDSLVSDAVENKTADEGDAASGLPVKGGSEDQVTELNADAIESMITDQAIKDATAIVPVSVDEIGIYELLKKKLAA